MDIPGKQGVEVLAWALPLQATATSRTTLITLGAAKSVQKTMKAETDTVSMSNITNPYASCFTRSTASLGFMMQSSGSS